MMNKKENVSLDRVGVCASLVCMVHCLMIPFLFVFGIDSLLWLVDVEWLELVFISASLGIGLVSFWMGYKRHRQHFVPVLFVAGFLLLINGEAVSGLWLAMSLSVAGALVIAYAHYQNIKWRRNVTTG